jgi:hypothetical protein
MSAAERGYSIPGFFDGADSDRPCNPAAISTSKTTMSGTNRVLEGDNSDYCVVLVATGL